MCVCGWCGCPCGFQPVCVGFIDILPERRCRQLPSLSATARAVSSKLNASGGCPTRCLSASLGLLSSVHPSVHPSIRSSVCLAACYCTPGLANALATNSSNLAQNWRLMTYVWHIAKLGDLMKFIIVLVSHRVRYNGIRCILRGFNKSLLHTDARTVGSESLCPTCGCYSNSFRPASALWSIKTTN